MISFWTEAVVERFKTLCLEKLSHAQIAKELGTTRNATIGKAHRLGLSPGKIPVVEAEEPVKPKRPSKIRSLKLAGIQVEFVPIPEEELPDIFYGTHPDDELIPAAQRKQCVDLLPCDCKFPVGVVGEESFFFCAAPRLEPYPYCTAHCLRAYRPPKK